MSNPGFVVVAVLALGAAYVLLPWAAHVFARYRSPRSLRCPETGGPAQVAVDAPHVALTAALGRPRLRAAGCTLWPARQGCARACLRLPEVGVP